MRAQLASAQTCGWLSQWYYGWGTFTSAINTAIEEHSWKLACLKWKFIPGPRNLRSFLCCVSSVSCQPFSLQWFSIFLWGKNLDFKYQILQFGLSCWSPQWCNPESLLPQDGEHSTSYVILRSFQLHPENIIQKLPSSKCFHLSLSFFVNAI